eukprot:tig00001264_g7872.t1
MGGDGGTCAVNPRFLPQGGQLNKRAVAKVTKTAEAEINYVRYTTCAISEKPLVEPIVACRVGMLYNKDAVLQCLLDKKMPAGFRHVRKMKDLMQCKLTPNPKFDEKHLKDGAHISQYICPITLLELNGAHRFNILWTCGHVIAERAMKEIPSSKCQVCETPFTDDDVVPVNGTKEEMENLRQICEQKFAAEKAAKAAEKAAASGAAEGESSKEAGAAIAKEGGEKKRKAEGAVAGRAEGSSPPAKRVDEIGRKLADAAKRVEEKAKTSATYASLFKAKPRPTNQFIKNMLS